MGNRNWANHSVVLGWCGFNAYACYSYRYSNKICAKSECTWELCQNYTIHVYAYIAACCHSKLNAFTSIIRTLQFQIRWNRVRTNFKCFPHWLSYFTFTCYYYSVISGFKYKNQFIELAQQNFHIECWNIRRTWMTMQQH